jgi:hypothetical protein
LGALRDIRCTTLTGEDAGSFKLTFVFDDNDFFKNKVGPRAGGASLMVAGCEVAPLRKMGGMCCAWKVWWGGVLRGGEGWPIMRS